MEALDRYLGSEHAELLVPQGADKAVGKFLGELWLILSEQSPIQAFDYTRPLVDSSYQAFEPSGAVALQRKRDLERIITEAFEGWDERNARIWSLARIPHCRDDGWRPRTHREIGLLYDLTGQRVGQIVARGDQLTAQAMEAREWRL